MLGDVAAVFRRPQEKSSPVRACERALLLLLLWCLPRGDVRPGLQARRDLGPPATLIWTVPSITVSTRQRKSLNIKTSSNKGPTLQSGFINTVFQCAKI